MYPRAVLMLSFIFPGYTSDSVCTSSISLTVQMFAGKECLVTIDRFSWTLLEYWRSQHLIVLYWLHDWCMFI